MRSPGTGTGVAASPGRRGTKAGAKTRSEGGRGAPGPAVQEWPDGAKYKGGFVDGYKHGKGKYTWSNGEFYEGSFYKDYRHGRGLYSWPTGHKFTGKFYLNRKEGYGQQRFPDGASFQGLYHADKRFGPGVVRHRGGRQDVGLWVGERLFKLCTAVGEGFSLKDYPEYAAYMDQAPITVSLTELPTSDLQPEAAADLAVDLDKDLPSDDFILLPGMESYSTDGDHLPLPPGRRKELDKHFYGKQWEPDAYQGYERDPLASLPLEPRLLAHMHKHRLQAERAGWDVAAVLALNRDSFGPKGPVEVSAESLIQHSSRGELQEVSRILQTGLVHVDVTDSQGHSALIAATINCNNDVIHLLLDMGADIDKLNCEGMSALAVCHVLYYPFQCLHTNLVETPPETQGFNSPSVGWNSRQISQVDLTTDTPRTAEKPTEHISHHSSKESHNGELITEQQAGINEPETPTDATDPQEVEGNEKEGEEEERGCKETGREGEGEERGSNETEREGEGEERGSKETEREGEGEERGSKETGREEEGEERGSKETEREGEGEERGSKETEREGEGEERGCKETEKEGEGEERGSKETEREGEGEERGYKKTELEGEGEEVGCKETGREGEKEEGSRGVDENESKGEEREEESRCDQTSEKVSEKENIEVREKVEEDVEERGRNTHEEDVEERGVERFIEVTDGPIALGVVEWKDSRAKATEEVQQGTDSELGPKATFDSDCSVSSFEIQVTEEQMQCSAEALSRSSIPQHSDTEETVRKMAAMKTEHRLRLNTLKLLLERGADPNASRVPMPVLFLAIMAADTEAVRRLLLCGALTDIPLPPKRKCRYPLHVAATLPGPAGPSITELLLHAVTDPDARACDQDEIYEHDAIVIKAQESSTTLESLDLKEGGRTALHMACQRDSDFENASEVVALLLSHGASTDLLWSGHSPLSLAIASGNDLAVEMLLKAGADPNIPLGRGLGTALCALANVNYHFGGSRTELLGTLVDAGADITMPVMVCDAEGTAVDYGHYSFNQDLRIANTPFHSLNLREREIHTARRLLLSMMGDLLREQRLLLNISGADMGSDSISSNVSLHGLGTRRKSMTKFCYQCGRSLFVKLAACNRCRKVFYCCKICQQTSWEKIHKEECILVSESVDGIEKNAMPNPRGSSGPPAVKIKPQTDRMPRSVKLKSPRVSKCLGGSKSLKALKSIGEEEQDLDSYCNPTENYSTN